MARRLASGWAQLSMTICIRHSLASLGLWPLLAGRDVLCPGDTDCLHCLVIAIILCRRSCWHNKSW